MITKYYTYIHYRKDSGAPFYIGKGKESRFTDKSNRGIYWKRVVEKHGFEAEILANWDTEEEAISHEKLLISCFREMGFKMANLTDGGDGTSGYKHTEETIAKMKSAVSEERKKKLAISMKGNKFREGLTISDFEIEKLKKRLIGNKYALGKPHSEESKKKRSEMVKQWWTERKLNADSH